MEETINLIKMKGFIDTIQVLIKSKNLEMSRLTEKGKEVYNKLLTICEILDKHI